MIRLDIQPYCDSCMDFTPDTEAPVRNYAGSRFVYQSDTIVRCKYRKRCENMIKYLQKQMEKPKD